MDEVTFEEYEKALGDLIGEATVPMLTGIPGVLDAVMADPVWDKAIHKRAVENREDKCQR